MCSKRMLTGTLVWIEKLQTTEYSDRWNNKTTKQKISRYKNCQIYNMYVEFTVLANKYQAYFIQVIQAAGQYISVKCVYWFNNMPFHHTNSNHLNGIQLILWYFYIDNYCVRRTEKQGYNTTNIIYIHMPTHES